ncbi:MAG: pre-peptidase C-terminal domain-containing protein [Chloroflexi bacterium]|nr:pre-peptidase C-terminal domain-containing protein [Chloroflexota bacterium]
MSHTISPTKVLMAGFLAFATFFAVEPGMVRAAGPGAAAPDLRSGERAIERLGDRLADAAKKMRVSERELRQTLRDDATLKVDSKARLLFVEKAPERSSISASAQWPTTPPYATSQTFALHSRPNATLKIYLDFTGHTTAGTRWNQEFTGGRAFTTPAFDLDGSRSTLSSDEHAAIQLTYLSVREDFAPFNVDVTTQDPGLGALTYSGAGDTTWGTRVVIGPNTWYPSQAGGVAYVGTFGSSIDTPVYVFANGIVSTKFVAEASSHETGHSLNLTHDGTTAGEEYYAGHGSWAPIMGNSYGRPISQWSAGEYTGANNQQNDLNVLGYYLGWLSDDIAGGTGTSATLPVGTNRYGVINFTNDVDAFKFSLGASRSITISTWNSTGPVDPNLNMRLVLRNSAGTVLATSSPTDSTTARMTVTLAAGTYYAYVKGVGEGTASTGWTAYDSLGFYGIVLN